MSNRQRGLCGCETCEFFERRKDYENDPNADWCECASCCRMFSEERGDYYVQRLTHRGLHHDRTEYAPKNMVRWGNIEKTLAELWERECAYHHHSDLEWPPGDVPKALLQRLLTVKDYGQVGHPETDRLEVNQEIATACAEVVQWFGSNCGIAFLMKAFERAGYTLTYRWHEDKR